MNILSQIKASKKTFIIAEIGQNHQGDINIAKQLIKVAKECGVDCVKFQKTCLTEKFTQSALDIIYEGPNSWGGTYGSHKEHLEFSEEEFLQLQTYSKDLGMMFTASAMDSQSFEFLKNIDVPFIKIGSGDFNNLLLMTKAAQSGIPLIISTGMADVNLVNTIYQLVSRYHKNFALLHCISAYPTPCKDVNLKVIPEFQALFPDVPIGYSGHELGIYVTVTAVALGAKIIERHITLDKNMKGTDHKCSLEPNEFKTMVAIIRDVEVALGQPLKQIQPSEIPCFKKLGKSLVYAKDLVLGHKLRNNDIKIKVSVPKGLDPLECHNILGKVLKCSVRKDDPVNSEQII
ncbi:sialic acid synthase [Euwallacea fornicatus]|uniref:sialic acid synthase n=1 Tax=Euwallacea fornicatus TaxID=995702 RepID=UPI00338DCE44